MFTWGNTSSRKCDDNINPTLDVMLFMTTRCEDLEPSRSGTGGTRVELFSYQASWGLFVQIHMSHASSHVDTILPPHADKTVIPWFYDSCRSLFIRQGSLLPYDRHTYGQRLKILWEFTPTGHMSVLISRHLSLEHVYLLDSLDDRWCCYP